MFSSKFELHASENTNEQSVPFCVLVTLTLCFMRTLHKFDNKGPTLTCYKPVIKYSTNATTDLLLTN